jgi:hypothetical protein
VAAESVSIRVGGNGVDVACADCGRRLLADGRDGHEWYLLRNPVWDVTGLPALGACACISCVERRLGRPLDWRDLDPDAGPINEPSERDSPKLHELKLAAQQARAMN